MFCQSIFRQKEKNVLSTLDFQLQQWHETPWFHICFYSPITLIYTPQMIQYQHNYRLMPSQLRLAEKMLAECVRAPSPCRNFSCHKFSTEKKMNQQDGKRCIKCLKDVRLHNAILHHLCTSWIESICCYWILTLAKSMHYSDNAGSSCMI